MKQYLSFIKKGIIAGAAITMLAFSGYALKSSGSDAATLPRDCEATAIIYCGSTSINELVTDYNTNDGGRYSDIPAVFNHFGISAAKIQNLGSSYKMGKVKADNTVWVGDQLVGVNAVTAGRSNKPGSVAIAGTGAFTRSPSVSFRTPSTSIDAFIAYENGVPAWAVLTSCGNPVKWDKPSISIEKTVRNSENTAWVEDDTFANNATLTYRLTVHNTSKVADTNVVVKDTLPSSNRFVAGSVKVNGSAKGGAGDSLISGGGLNIGTLNPGATAEITFQAKVSVAETKCGETKFMNKAVADGHLTSPVEDSAGGSVQINCAVVKCDQLNASSTAIKLGQSITFTAYATVEHASIKSYEFKVNGKSVQNTTTRVFSYTPENTGTFTAKVSVVTDKATATSTACEKKVVVTQDVAFACDMLTLSRTAIKPGETVVATAKASTVNSVVQRYEFRVNGTLVQNTASSTHSFTPGTAGTYTIKVSVVTDKGTATSSNCEAKLSVAETPQCPYDSTLPPDSPDCKEPTPPQVLGDSTLPKTGAGSTIGLFTAVTIVGAVFHRAFIYYKLGR